MARSVVIERDAAEQIAAGHAAVAVGDWSAAKEAFGAAAELEPTAEAFFGLGFAARLLGEQALAIRSLRRAYRLQVQGGDPRGAAGTALQLGLCELYFH